MSSLFKPIPQRKFNNDKLRLEALTHKSYCYENPMSGHHNERLEFLGDSIIGFVVADYLYNKYPDYKEGQLTMLRAKIVCKQTLANFAGRLGLDRDLRLGAGSSNSRNNEKILEDAFEAYIGAIFLDSGKDLKCVLEFLEPFVGPLVEELNKPMAGTPINLLPGISELQREKIPPMLGPEDLKLPFSLEHQDPIGKLQTWSLKKGFPIPFYREVKVEGIAHDPRFTIQVQINGIIAGEGEGRNKKEAKKQAASKALARLLNSPDLDLSQKHLPNFGGSEELICSGPSN
ncbi:3622_t:CDS:1 [Diversispora eburnea]|uniref:ribonuclease III n=1 Tax=Diversispora eburnea TaxID=1213867 RepID=A0A9N8Z8Z8_9GLOM|nr:3622_t:CDS:1 [Diversispora eburnea]